MESPMTKAAVATFIDLAIDASAKTAKQIAREAGFENPNFLSMVRKGESKLPLGRIEPLAVALGVPTPDLLNRCLEAYHPDIYRLIARVHPSILVTPSEFAVIRVMRKAMAGMGSRTPPLSI